jgi:hypothetical protein
MNTFRSLCVAGALTVAAISAVAADSSGISIPGPNVSENEFYSKTYSGANGGLPTIVTNAAAVLATNIVAPVLKDQPVNGAIRLATAAGAGSNNIVAYFKLSWDGGRTYSTVPKLSWNFNPNITTEFIDGFSLVYTSLLGATHIKLDKLSNAIPAASAAANFYPSNFTFSVRRK